MKYVELSGLIKFDFLGLTTLTILDKATKLISSTNKNFKLNEIIMDDPKTFKMLGSGRTTGVFQLESSGMKDVLKRLKPGQNGEIHITDAIRKLIYKREKFIGHIFSGKYLDCGTMKGYINSSIEVSKI